MKYIKTVGDYKIFEASKAECEVGYRRVKREYPCFCAFYKDDVDPRTVLEFNPQLFGISECDFCTLDEAEECIRDYLFLLRIIRDL